MAKSFGLKFNTKGWNELVKEIIDTEGVQRMQRVADACNAGLESGQQGYMVSTEGDDQLKKHDYRATVITATGEAMRDNAKNQSLVRNFHLAGGD